jgi:hypothetical protein
VNFINAGSEARQAPSFQKFTELVRRRLGRQTQQAGVMVCSQSLLTTVPGRLKIMPLLDGRTRHPQTFTERSKLKIQVSNPAFIKSYSG